MGEGDIAKVVAVGTRGLGALPNKRVKVAMTRATVGDGWLCEVSTDMYGSITLGAIVTTGSDNYWWRSAVGLTHASTWFSLCEFAETLSSPPFDTIRKRSSRWFHLVLASVVGKARVRIRVPPVEPPSPT